MDCIYAVEELKTSLADLQQQKLDNIVDDFESLASWSNAVSSRADALMNYYTAVGKAVNSREAKDALGTQRHEAQLMVGRYQQEADAYEKILKEIENSLAKGTVGWEKNSTRYREAKAKYEEIQQQLVESQTKVRELDKQIFELDVTKIEYVLDRLKQFSEKVTSIFNLKEVRGTQYGQPDSVITENDYMGQVRANNDVIKMLAQHRDKEIEEIATLDPEKDAEEYKELYDAIMADEQEIFNLLQSNEELKQSIRELRWKPFKELQKQLVEVNEDFEHLRGLITDAQMFDEGKGTTITAKGYANLAMLAEQMFIARRQIADYREALNKLQKEYKNNNISLEKFNEESREYIKTIQSSVEAVEGYKDTIVDMYKTQIQNENSALQELINKRRLFAFIH